jgi:hypothetical protein
MILTPRRSEIFSRKSSRAPLFLKKPFDVFSDLDDIMRILTELKNLTSWKKVLNGVELEHELQMAKEKFHHTVNKFQAGDPRAWYHMKLTILFRFITFSYYDVTLPR